MSNRQIEISSIRIIDTTIYKIRLLGDMSPNLSYFRENFTQHSQTPLIALLDRLLSSLRPATH